MAPVRDDTAKPSPTEYPPLLPTLPTRFGMVLKKGQPRFRPTPIGLDQYNEQAAVLYGQSSFSQQRGLELDANPQLYNNFRACAIPVTKHELLTYIRHAHRLDIEQAVAMAIGYLKSQLPTTAETTSCDDFESSGSNILEELMNDQTMFKMLTETYMFRMPDDYVERLDPLEAAQEVARKRILEMLGVEESVDWQDDTAFVATVQQVRRKRSKLNNTQHLTLPISLLPTEKQDMWSFDNIYSNFQRPIEPIHKSIISRRTFSRIQRRLIQMQGGINIESAYVRAVLTFIRRYGVASPDRIAALEDSLDPVAIAYSFIALQRKLQQKVVSDTKYKRFLVKGEAAMVLQNRPDILTSFEDVLVRRAKDLKALTAILCPQGVRSYFTTESEIRSQTREICELMEQYVNLFGQGDIRNLIFPRKAGGGKGRGPVDLYNALCTELNHCRARSKSAGMELDIGAVHKFLAKDIMAWNNSWDDDAFANGKVPGWIDYLAREREKSVSLDDPDKNSWELVL